MDNRTLTIMFTDLKGFTARTSSQSRDATLGMIRKHKELLTPIFQAKKGKIIKTIGDAFLVVFNSPTNAVLAGIELQKILKDHNISSDTESKMEVRVAINTGEVTVEDNDVYGEPVNIAARLEGIAEANEIYFTEATYLAMNKSEVPTAEIGYRVFKGIPDRIKIFKVLREGESKSRSSVVNDDTQIQKQVDSNMNEPDTSIDENFNSSGIQSNIYSEEGTKNKKHHGKDKLSKKDHQKKVNFMVPLLVCISIGMIAGNIPAWVLMGVAIGNFINGLLNRKDSEYFAKHAFTAFALLGVSIGFFTDQVAPGAIIGVALGMGARYLIETKEIE